MKKIYCYGCTNQIVPVSSPYRPGIKRHLRHEIVKSRHEKFTRPVITIEGKEANEFYKRNPAVASISRQGNIITLKMKDNTTGKYDLGKKEEKKIYRQIW